jgi:hypothetical protein
MKFNVGTIDKAARILIAAVIIILFLTHVISGTLGIILLAVSGIFILTAFVGFCPLYWVINVNTKEKKK